MGDPFDGRVDQYALAVTAYELLCGRRPFEHEVPTRVLLMQAQDAAPSLVSHCPWASSQLEAALLKASAKNPEERYLTCVAFSAAVVAASGVEQAGRGASPLRVMWADDDGLRRVAGEAEPGRAEFSLPQVWELARLAVSAPRLCSSPVARGSRPGVVPSGPTSTAKHGRGCEPPVPRGNPGVSWCAPSGVRCHAQRGKSLEAPTGRDLRKRMTTIRDISIARHSPGSPSALAATVALVVSVAPFWATSSSRSEGSRKGCQRPGDPPRRVAPVDRRTVGRVEEPGSQVASLM